MTLIDSLRHQPDALKRDLSHADIDKLLRKLCTVYTLHELPSTNKRVAAFVISRELSMRGVAPRWQFDDSDDSTPLDKITRDKDEREEVRRSRKIKQQDRIIFDLLWVSIAYPEHITNNSNWQQLFRCKDDWLQWLSIASSIEERKANLSKKTKGLRLNDEQLLGCRYLCGSRLNEQLIRLEERTPKVKDKIEKSTALITSQRNQLDVNARARYWLVGKITSWSPSKGARVYKMMTGRSVTKQAVAKTYAKVKEIL